MSACTTEADVRKGPEDSEHNKTSLRHSNVSIYLIESCFKNMINYIHYYICCTYNYIYKIYIIANILLLHFMDGG